MRSSSTTRALGALTIALALALASTACGNDSSDDAPQPSATEHNEADVAFASDMLQHHAQALSMVDLTAGRPLDPEVQQLAESIREAQGPEIETFTDWLTAWGGEVPATMRDHTNAHDMGDMDDKDADMPGMTSAEDLAALEESSDAEFQDRWLEMMVEHHTGAVEMAESEQQDGRYQPAIELAGTIEDAQSAEIDTMSELLG